MDVDGCFLFFRAFECTAREANILRSAALLLIVNINCTVRVGEGAACEGCVVVYSPDVIDSFSIELTIGKCGLTKQVQCTIDGTFVHFK